LIRRIGHFTDPETPRLDRRTRLLGQAGHSPLAEAQQSKAAGRVAFLGNGSAVLSGPLLDAFHVGLGELGYVEGNSAPAQEISISCPGCEACVEMGERAIESVRWGGEQVDVESNQLGSRPSRRAVRPESRGMNPGKHSPFMTVQYS
jgi:hypothetical protein